MFDSPTSFCRVRRVVALLTLSTLGLLSESAWAQPNDSDKQAARELMTKGRAERDAGNLQGALESFSRAHSIMNVPTTLLEMARAQAALGQWLEALALVRQLRATPARPDDPPPFARARAEAEELGRTLETRMPTLHLDLTGAPEPSSTTVSIDGALRQDCTQACSVNPGKHLLVARSRAAQAEEQLIMAEGETLKLEVVFSPQPPDPRQMRQIGEEQQPSVRARAGATDRSSSARIPTLVWALGGVAVAGAAGGVVFGRSAVDQRDELRESCAPRCSTDQVDGVRRRALIANLSFGLGAAAAAGAVAAYFIRPAAKENEPPSAALSAQPRRVSVWAAPQRAGGYVSVQGDF